MTDTKQIDLGFAKYTLTPYMGKPLLLQLDGGDYVFSNDAYTTVIGVVEAIEPAKPTHTQCTLFYGHGHVKFASGVEPLEMLSPDRWRVRITEGVFEGGGAEVEYCHRRRKWYGFPTGRRGIID